jgi:hypothetical protein
VLPEPVVLEPAPIVLPEVPKPLPELEPVEPVRFCSVQLPFRAVSLAWPPALASVELLRALEPPAPEVLLLPVPDAEPLVPKDHV